MAAYFGVIAGSCWAPEVGDGRRRQDRMDYEAYVINLDRSEERMAKFRAAFANVLPVFTRVSGCVGSTIPDIISEQLRRNFPSGGKGGLGATLSHVTAWEKTLQSDKPYGIILEDDTEPLRKFPQYIEELGLDIEFDVCFANQRMSMFCSAEQSASSYVSCIDALRNFPANHNAPGGDCYILSKSGADKLLKSFGVDGFGSFLDWRIVAYCVSRNDIKTLEQDSTAKTVVGIMHAKSIIETPLKGRVLLSPLVKALGGPSDIGMENNKK
jgi:GR25 family glycosyltransferase involved in LPS biosynthesis